MEQLKVKQFADALKLETLVGDPDQVITFITGDVNRPGLQLTGFFDYFASDRIQIIGKAEIAYLHERCDSAQRTQILERLMQYEVPAVLLSRSQEAPQELLEACRKFHRPLFRSPLVTTKLVNSTINFLNILLAPRITEHGVLLDVAGVGVMLTGESGLGKSETALELIKRGHRLVADDVVEISRLSNDQLIGTSPESVRHFMEIRGIGIVDIRALYGSGAVLMSKAIDIVVQLEPWDSQKQYERLGLDDNTTEILGVTLPIIVLPVRPGRNLAMVTEVAARNMRLKSMGYNAAMELHRRLNANLDVIGDI
ncbi:MAG: HPr(Ser) kinase/phosphatase [Oscillospiraceae bacterium]|nr:HPr(Ser) kinase/phosphatase [Oscillospiraceae bacterium]